MKTQQEWQAELDAAVLREQHAQFFERDVFKAVRDMRPTREERERVEREMKAAGFVPYEGHIV